EPFQTEWLAKYGVKSLPPQAGLVVLAVIAGEGDEKRAAAGARFVFADGVNRLNPAHLGHLFIKQDDVKMLVEKSAESFPAVADCVNVVAATFQLIGGQRANVFLIVGKQNAH